MVNKRLTKLIFEYLRNRVTKFGWHKEVQKDFEQIPNIEEEEFKHRNKFRKIIEEFNLEEKINRQRRRGELAEERKIRSENMKAY